MHALRTPARAALILLLGSCTLEAPEPPAAGSPSVAVSSEALTYSNCSSELAGGCAYFGCGCIDEACNGGFCQGSGCTKQQTDACAAFGCGCADGECSGGFCSGNGCTLRETNDCQADGRSCSVHACQPAPATAIGATDGEFMVGQSGDASYSIALQVVPGTGGIQPNLRLVYNSSGGDSPLGVGWMLGGVSSIMRCAANLEQDGFVDGVDYDANDRFCLDGQRLVAVRGAYGADGTEYRTELDSFARIYSYGMAPGGGPERFLVQQKSGEIIQYGFTEDARVDAVFRTNALPRVVGGWAINRLEDRLGNYLTFSYQEFDGEHYVTRIDYTGNAAAGLAPYASVRFGYEPRPDPLEGYQGGAYTLWKVRLERVVMFLGETTTRRYELGYSQSAAGRSVLSWLQECGADGQCLPATRLESATQAPGFESTTRTVLPAGSGGVHAHSTSARNEAIVDLDGDGDLDRSWIPDGRVDVYASLWNGTSFDPPTVWLTTAAAGFNAFSDQGRFTAWTDLNGDNKADYVWIPFRLNSIYVALSTGTRFAAPVIWHSPGGVLPWSDGAVLEAYTDVNGDALPDRVFGRNGAIYVLLNTGSSFTTTQTWLAAPVVPQPLNYSAGNTQQDFVDLNQDGRTDFVWVPQDRNDLYVALSNGSSFDPPTIWLQNANTGLRMLDSDVYVDMTGDGLPDRVVSPSGNASEVRVAVNTGRGFLPATAWLSGNEASSDPAQRIYSADPRQEQLVDLNDDGRPDRVWVNPITNTVWASYSVAHHDFDSGAISFDLGAPRELITRAIGGTPYAAGGMTEAQLREQYADIDGDGSVDKIYSPPDGVAEFRLLRGNRVSHLLSKITNGFGRERLITYNTLRDPAVYTQDHDAVFPVMDAGGAMKVVHFLHTSDGIGGKERNRYAYYGLKMHLRGLGNLGMRQTVEVEETGAAFTIRQFSQDYTKRLHGMLLAQGRIGPGFIALRNTVNSYNAQKIQESGGARFVAGLKDTVTTSRDLNNAFVGRSRNENLESDAFGNVVRMRRTILSENDAVQSQSDVVNAYANDTASWSLGLLTSTAVTQSLPTASPPVAAVTRATEQTWNVGKRLLTQEVLEPAVAELRLVRQYAYDAFGNRTSTTTSGFDIATRTSTTTYDPTGRFAVRTQNPLNQVLQNTYDARTGAVLTTTDTNNVTIAFAYDGFARKTRQTDPDQTAAVTELRACASNCPANAVYSMVSTPAGGAPRTAYIDMLGRVVREETLNLEGARTLVDRRYDGRGRNTEMSNPYFEGATPLWTRITYDDLDRVVRIDNPDGTFSTMSYNGLTSTVTNELNQTTLVTSNLLSQKVEVRDPVGSVLRYRYDPFENLIEIRDPAGNVTSMTYDRQGRKTAVSDPDKGAWTYAYDALGELRRQTDAKAQVMEQRYDVLGRMTARIDAVGGTQQQVTLWTYDTASNGKGALTSVKQLRCTAAVSTCLANVATSPEYAEIYSYDTLNRQTRVDTRIGTQSFLIDSTYDSFGRLATMTYPDSGGQRLRTRNAYNERGYLTRVTNDLNATALWTANSSDARGNLTSFSLGNGLTTKRSYDAVTGFMTKIETGTASSPTSVQNLEVQFDAVGNLKSRRDARINFSETASYDALNRLTSVVSKLGSASPTTVNASYDALGNLTSRDDAGAYTYARSCAGGTAGAHAVTSVIKSGVTTGYCYDGNGNMIQSGARTIEWAPFDKPTRFKNGTVEARFEYGPSRQRYRRTDVSSTGATTTTVYVAGMFERVTTSSQTEYRNFIGDYAVYKRIVASTTTTATLYFHQDHLGSLNAVSDASRAVTERFNFDPWGNRRAVVSGDRTTTSAHTTRGFTDQEQIDAFKLVHMNGRVYDPTIGRFISADPFVQNPDNLQAYNRYSYVMNNPLSYTDPSGYFRIGNVFKSIRTYLKNYFKNLVRLDLKAQLRNVATLWSEIPGLQIVAGVVACIVPVGCLAFAAITAAVQLATGASIGDVLPGLALAAISFGLAPGGGAAAQPQLSLQSPLSAAEATLKNSGNILKSAVVMGAIAEAQGGKFKDGFVSGLRSGAVSTFAQGVLGLLPEPSDPSDPRMYANGDDSAPNSQQQQPVSRGAAINADGEARLVVAEALKKAYDQSTRGDAYNQSSVFGATVLKNDNIFVRLGLTAKYVITLPDRLAARGLQSGNFPPSSSRGAFAIAVALREGQTAAAYLDENNVPLAAEFLDISRRAGGSPVFVQAPDFKVYVYEDGQVPFVQKPGF